jgi:gamma-glutamyltranspeptidase/glutathione hydrolase
MQEDDLASHVTEAAEPLRVAWRGFDVLAHPPNSQAGCLLLALGMLAADGDREPGLWTHLAVEAMKRALAIRDALICDPATHPSELPALLAPERLRAMRSRIDPERATDVPGACDRGDTVAICVVDENGMAVSLIESLFNGFGSGIVAEDTGVVLHNRGAYFAADPAALNAYAPGKRPLHTLSPAMVLRDGAPALVLGTMGGDGQPQILLQVLHAILERGLDVQTALDAPRWVYGRHAVAGRPDVLEHAHVLVEPAFDPAIVAALERRGHRVVAADAFGAFGHAHAIAIDRAAGTLAGGADPRADSAALGL